MLKPFEQKILIYHPSEAEQYAEQIRQYGYSSICTASTPEQAKRALPETEVVLCWKFPTELLSLPAAGSIRWIQSMGAGVDDWLNVENFPDTTVLTRIVDQFGGPIAEYVFAHLLSFTLNLPRMRKAQTEQLWDPFVPDYLAGKTIGVAGLGSIGMEIVKKARAFDMKVYGLSQTGQKADAVDRHFQAPDWIRFVRELDYLVLTLPLTKETFRCVDREVLLAMKSSAIFVNVGRGKLVAQEELVDVMRSGHLLAAVLDVFEQEPLPQHHPFWTMPNVIVTPHLSGPSTPQDICRFFAANLKRYQEGQPLAGTVNRNLGY